MNFDATLNLIWGLVGLLALVGVVWIEFRRGNGSLQGRWLHIVRVGIIVTALFPFISASDDALQLEHLSRHLSHQDESRQTTPHQQSSDLLRLYDTMDHPVLVGAKTFALMLFFLAFVLGLSFAAFDRSAPFRAGRSPPVSVGV